MIHPRLAPLLPYAATILGLSFIGILTALHFLKPELDPSWRLVSEYEIGKFGFLMSLAFFCWAGGVMSLAFSIWDSLHSVGGFIGRWWLLVISIALFGAGIFVTDPIIQIHRSLTDRYHALCGVLMIFTFPIASSLLAISLAREPEFKSSRQLLLWATLLVWIGFFSFISSLIAFHPKGRDYNPSVWIGWPNRLMVLTYTLWLLATAWASNRTLRLKIKAVRKSRSLIKNKSLSDSGF